VAARGSSLSVILLVPIVSRNDDLRGFNKMVEA
jgi:hypothetical protein